MGWTKVFGAPLRRLRPIAPYCSSCALRVRGCQDMPEKSWPQQYTMRSTQHAASSAPVTGPEEPMLCWYLGDFGPRAGTRGE